MNMQRKNALIKLGKIRVFVDVLRHFHVEEIFTSRNINGDSLTQLNNLGFQLSDLFFVSFDLLKQVEASFVYQVNFFLELSHLIRNSI